MLKKLGEKLLRVKPVYVLDATPVIHFAKIGKLGLISEICDPVLVESVYTETTIGDYPDTLLIRDLVDKGVLRVFRVEDRESIDVLTRFPEIHIGEAETLVASRLLEGLAVVDDSAARAVAEVFGYNVARGSLFLLFKLLQAGVVDASEADNVFDMLVQHGLYLDPRTVLRAKELLNRGRG